RTSVCVRQHTQNVRVCPSAQTRCPWLSMCVRVCPSAHTGRPWLSITTHISTLVLGLSMLALRVDSLARWPFPWTVWVILAHVGCLFSTHRTSVGVCQHTQDIQRLCVSVSTNGTSVADRVCPSAHTRRLWLFISTHISTLVLGISTLALPVDCLDDFGPRGLSVQYTKDVRGCPPTHTGRLWLSVAVVNTHRTFVADVLGCPCVSVCVRQHAQDVRGCPSVHISARWTSVGVRLHKQDVCVCPSAHTGHLWLCVCVRVTHRTSVAVHQYTYQHVGPWTQHAGPSRGLTLALPVDCLGDFGPRGLFVQYTQDVRGCPPAHTGRSWLFVAVHKHTQDVCGCSTHMTSVCVQQHTQDVCGCPCVSVSTHRTSVAVHQYTYQHLGP
ncbi:unnamed protein product, partial [Brassica rapa]